MPTTSTRPGIAARSERTVALLDVTVLAGGPGAEREVSLESGRAVSAALERIGHRVALCDIGPGDLTALDHEADFVFIALHGEFGEDGTVQELLDHRGIKYSGSGAAASRVAMDKVQTKRIFQQAGIPTPGFYEVNEETIDEAIGHLHAPCVVKPVSSGSSVDTFICHTDEAIRRAGADVVRKYGTALVERYIAGRELTVGILGALALPVCEIRTRRAFYDYAAKYLDDDTQYLFDLDLSGKTIQRVQEIAGAAHEALSCRVFSRVDFMIDGRTNEPFVLEVNTIPGFTSHSLVPKAAARVGIGFDELCQRIIELSMASHRGDIKREHS